jgi:hypothetical protein
MADKGFFGNLFDLSFSEFITVRIVKVLFIVAIVASAIGALVMLGGGIAALRFRPLVGLVTILLSPLAFCLYVILARIWLEIVLVIFRIAENTTQLVEQGKSQTPKA